MTANNATLCSIYGVNRIHKGRGIAAARAGTAVDAVFACAYHADGQAPYAIADHFWRKPNPGMIVEGLRRLNGAAARSAMVGDQPGDIAAARAAGLGFAVLVERASGDDGAGADAVARSFGEAVTWIARADINRF